MTRRTHRVRRWLAGGIVVLLAAGFGGPLIYNHVSTAPALLALPDAGTVRATAGSASLEGRWHVGTGSIAGFRVPTCVLGYCSTVVGRTGWVHGSLTIAGTIVRSASFTGDVAGIDTSDSARSLMDVRHYPTAMFQLTRPIALVDSSYEGEVRHHTATGSLTFHGTTRPVSISLAEERLGSTLYALADIPVTFAAWKISVPYGVANSGMLEVLLRLNRGADAGV